MTMVVLVVAAVLVFCLPLSCSEWLCAEKGARDSEGKIRGNETSNQTANDNDLDDDEEQVVVQVEMVEGIVVPGLQVVVMSKAYENTL
jgi:hypothetical protein